MSLTVYRPRLNGINRPGPYQLARRVGGRLANFAARRVFSYGGGALMNNLVRQGTNAANVIGKAYKSYKWRSNNAANSAKNKRSKKGVNNSYGNGKYKTPTGRNVRNKGKKNVHVNKQFKAKVMKALESKAPVGRYNMQYNGTLPLVPAVNSQWVDAVIYDGSRTSAIASASGAISGPIDFFSARRVLDAASVMFNSKARDVNYQVATGNFGVQGLKVDVVYQTVEIKFRNNTNLLYEIDWYECVPKVDTDIAPNTFWANALASEAGKQNLHTTLATTYGATPGMIDGFTHVWKYTKRIVKLEPGQNSQFVIKGPKMTYDFDRMVSDTGLIAVFPKGVGTYCFYVVKNPLIHTGVVTGQQSGHQSQAVNLGIGVTIEVLCKTGVAAPDVSEDVQKFDKFSMLYGVTTVPIVKGVLTNQVDSTNPQSIYAPLL